MNEMQQAVLTIMDWCMAWRRRESGPVMVTIDESTCEARRGLTTTVIRREHLTRGGKV